MTRTALPRIGSRLPPRGRRSGPRRGLALGLSAACWLAAAPARADAADSTDGAAVERASRAYQALDYEQAIALAAPVVDRATAPVAPRIDAALLVALAHLALVDPADPGGADSARHQDAAERALRAVLALQWDFELDRGYPAPMHAAFAAARAAVERARAARARAACATAPALTLEALPRPRGGRDLPLVVRLADPRGCARTVRVTWARDRVTTSSLNRVLLPVRAGAVTWQVPAAATTSATGTRLAFYAEAFDGDHGRLATLGSFEQPRTLDVAPGAPAPPLVRRWWFWAAVGAVAIGTGVLIDQARDPGPSTIVIRR